MKTITKLLLSTCCVWLFACGPAQDSTPLVTASDSTDSSMAATPMTQLEQEAASECTLRLGIDVWEPYQYVDVNNEIRGMDVELVTTAMRNIGCEIEVVQGPWVSLLNELKDGAVDVLLGASKTSAREEYAHFSIPYRMEEFALYIRNDDQQRAEYATIDEFIVNESRIGIVGEYYYGPEVSALLDNESTATYFVPAIIGEMNIARLLDQDIDGYLEDSLVGASMLWRKGLKNYVKAHGFKIQTGEIYVMFSKESVALTRVEQVNEQLELLRENGTFAKLVDKYKR
ncbi:substrate-binding periplasmic protein [Alteromonas flava]|uniref:substrate-binding periplasmic protein n=1 Tax=Alteromonas flava TaxID=2048003 RepID=UPI000C28ED64|nr:transporter substrate-binding domain-containing protein [Alteromonas flava]